MQLSSVLIMFLRSCNVAVFLGMLIILFGFDVNAIDMGWSKKMCLYSTSYSLMQADCSQMDLMEIPKNLKADIQVKCFFFFI